jgi:hypothetical protein
MYYLLALLGVVRLAATPFTVLMPTFADRILHGGPRAQGWLTGAPRRLILAEDSGPKRCRWSGAPMRIRAGTLAGPSDIPTILLGDKLIVNGAAYQLKLPYCNVTLFRTALPKRGDFG